MPCPRDGRWCEEHQVYHFTKAALTRIRLNDRIAHLENALWQIAKSPYASDQIKKYASETLNSGMDGD